MTDVARLDPALTARRAARRVPALSAAAARRGHIEWAAAAGRAEPGRDADPDVAFRIGSISKPMTAVAVLRLVAAGRVGLNDPVGRHVRDAPVPDASVAQLLTHTSGLTAEPPGRWWERHGSGSWADLVASGPERLWEPGERFHYSNVGYAVLGRLVEEAHGRPWDDVLSRELWEPLGMTRTARTAPGGAATGYAVHPHADVVLAEPVAAYGAMGPAGEVWSTPSDLVRFGSWLVGAGGADDDALVLPLAWRRRMTVPRVVADEAGGPFARAWGLGVSIRHGGQGAGDGLPRRTVGHGGSVPGFTAELRVDVASGDAVAVCGSSTAGFGDAEFLLEAFRTTSDGYASLPLVAPTTGERVRRPDGAPSADRAPRADDASSSLTGTWYWGPSPFAVRLDGRLLQLHAADDGGRGSAFAPAPGRPGEWVGVERGYWLGERLRLVSAGPDPDSGPALDVGTFHLTRAPYDPRTAVPGGARADDWRPAEELGIRPVG